MKCLLFPRLFHIWSDMGDIETVSEVKWVCEPLELWQHSLWVFQSLNGFLSKNNQTYFFVVDIRFRFSLLEFCDCLVFFATTVTAVESDKVLGWNKFITQSRFSCTCDLAHSRLLLQQTMLNVEVARFSVNEILVYLTLVWCGFAYNIVRSNCFHVIVNHDSWYETEKS